MGPRIARMNCPRITRIFTNQRRWAEPTLRFRSGKGFRCWRGWRSDDGGEYAVDVDVAVLEEDAIAGLGAAGGSAGDVEAGDGGFHGVLIVERHFVVADQLNAGHAGEGHVGEIA